MIVLLALGLGLLQQLLELDGREALLAVGAVVGHHVQMIAAGAHLLLEHDDALGAEARDDVDIAAEAVRLLGLRPRDGAAGAAADDHDLVHVVKLGGVAERADNVGHIVAGLLAGEQGRRAADALHDDRHGAGLTIIGRDRDGHTLAELVDAEHQELTRLRLAGDERGLERDAEHIVR